MTLGYFYYLLIGVNGQRSIEFPENTVAVVDDDAKLTCSCHSKSCLETRWQKLSVDRGQKTLQISQMATESTIAENTGWIIPPSANWLFQRLNLRMLELSSVLLPGLDTGLPI